MSPFPQEALAINRGTGVTQITLFRCRGQWERPLCLSRASCSPALRSRALVQTAQTASYAPPPGILIRNRGTEAVCILQ